MRLIVVGGGIGGLALAIAAGRRGMGVVLLEQAAAFSEVGAGVQLSPNAVRALEALGVAAATASVSTRPFEIEVRDQASGARLLHTPLGASAEARWGAPYLQAHRADLHAVLLSAARETPNVEIRTGARVACAQAAVEGATIGLEGGERLVASVAVGCDGVRSVVRGFIAPDQSARFTGQVAWRGLAPAAGLDPEFRMPGARVWTGPGRHFVHYPVRGGALINFIAVTEERAWRTESWSEEGSRDVLAQAFAPWPSSVRALIGAAPQVMRWALYDRAPLPRWSQGPLTLLGDAAHPMLPFLAQGAAMALEDAVVLSACLEPSADGREEPSLGLLRYEALRKARTSKVQAWSRRNARLFHLPSSVARTVFGAAATADLIRRRPGAERLDWLYGYDPVAAV